MKNLFYILFAMLIFTEINAAEVFVQDSVLTGPAYKQEVYYSLHNAQSKSSDANLWDIAFEIIGAGYSILSNDGYGVQVYYNPSLTYEDFENNVDLDDVKKNWKQLYNSVFTWTEGAFVNSKDPENDFDLGWGEYSLATHSVIASRFYVVKTITGKWKKIVIDDLTARIYNFRIANLDGTELIEKSLNKSNYEDRNFAYYSIDNDTFNNFEPSINEWDIVFTKYISMEGENKDTPYPVTGVKTNPKIKSIRVGTNSPETHPIPDVADFTTNITTIGSDWKRFDGTKFVISDTLAFFLYRTDTQKSFRLLFTGFGGSSTGKYVFKREEVATSVSDNNDANSFSLSVYPNVINRGETVSVFSDINDGNIEIFSNDGKLIYTSSLSSNNELSIETISTANLSTGMYYITLTNKFGKAIQKLIVQ
ncbi:hypothetical protein MASR1M45_15440 [Candidatus Kapaibacterium sp.]